MKAQVAVEFLTAYGWALLAVIIAAVAAFYFLSATQSIPSECNFGNSFQCTTYQFIKNSDGTMKLTFQMTNSLGKRIMFYKRQQILTVQNIGKSGINNYTGVCVGPADIVQSGDDIVCMFNITDKQFTPSVGKISAFTVLLNYTNCDTSSIPGSCINGMNRSFQGKINSDLELAPTIVAPRCKDMKCDTGENYTNCPWDCPPPSPAYITVTFSINFGSNGSYNIKDPFIVTVLVRDSSYTPLKNAYVYLSTSPYMSGYECIPPTDFTYTAAPNPIVTDSSGYATSFFQVNWCSASSPCIISSYFTFNVVATSGDATRAEAVVFNTAGNCV